MTAQLTASTQTRRIGLYTFPMEHMEAVEKLFIAERKETEAYPVTVLGDTYTILPGVFSPKVRGNSAWFAEKVPPLVIGKSFLEIGAGAGVLAVRCAKRGHAVVATDISPDAVRNIALNAKAHGVSVDVREGSVFEPIGADERFDTVFWNHPWVYADEEVGPERQATFDQGYRFLESFLTHGKGHLTAGGCMLLGSGSLARADLIEDMARKAGYRLELVLKERQPLQVDGETEVDFMIYRLTV